MTRNIVSGFCLVALLIAVNSRADRPVPTFDVDPSWPKLPNNWVLGEVSAVAVGPRDHVWVLHRPRTVAPDQKANAAPAVLEFDEAGPVVSARGGPARGCG